MTADPAGHAPQTLSPVFICGHRKCGTSLFLRLLDNHPLLDTYPQDLFTLYAYYPHFVRREAARPEFERRLLDVTFRDMEATFAKVTPGQSWRVRAMRDAFQELLRDADLKDLKTVLTAQITAFKAAFGREGSRHQVLKETSVELYAATLSDSFPQARFIQVLRDPRDNYAALKSGVDKYYSAFGDTANTVLMSMIHRYGMGMRACGMNSRRFGPERYHVVRHEDVVMHTQETMRGVADFLDVPFSETMLQPSMLGQAVEGNSYENHPMRAVNPVNVSRWRERISESEACIVEFFFKDVMEQYGYECAFSEQRQMDAASEFYKWSNYKYFHFDRFA